MPAPMARVPMRWYLRGSSASSRSSRSLLQGHSEGVSRLTVLGQPIVEWSADERDMDLSCLNHGVAPALLPRSSDYREAEQFPHIARCQPCDVSSDGHGRRLCVLRCRSFLPRLAGRRRERACIRNCLT